MAKHLATGKPKGRPSKLPKDIGEKILNALKKRIDPTTGLADTDWKGICKELEISRSTLARRLAALRGDGCLERVCVEDEGGVSRICYRLFR